MPDNFKIKFGTDGWRGIIDKDFNQENVRLATQAIANYFLSLGKKKIVIGYDFRKKADFFAKEASRVLAASGIKVYLVDKPCPTPTTGWSIIDKKADGAIMFTASHNPPEFLGLKYMTEEVMSAPNEVTDQFVENLVNLKLSDVKLKDFKDAKKAGKIKIFDPKSSYFRKLKKMVDINKIKKAKLKVLINPMHAVGIGYLSELIKGDNLEVEVINNEPDPKFGGNPPEPIVEKNVSDAIEKVKKEHFNLCLSVDGDADRIGLINENGKMLTSLEAFLLLAYYLLIVKGIRGPIVGTLSNAVMVKHLCQKYNLPYYETKVGFKYVGEKMKETGAILGGEESGGSTVKEHILVRDAQLMNLYVLDLLVSLGKPLSEILEIAKKEAGGGYESKREDIHFDYETYDEVKTKKTAELIKNPPKEILNKKVIKTRTDDGLKFYFEDDSWLLIRFSGTEPVLRLYTEAKTMAEVEKLLSFAKEFFGK